MSLTAALRTFFSAAASLGDQLAQGEHALRDIHAEVEGLRAQRPELARRKLLGDAAAPAKLQAVDAAIAAGEARLRDLRDAVAATKATIAANTATARKDEVQARPRRLAELRRERLASAVTIAENMAACVAEIQKQGKNGSEIAGLLRGAGHNGRGDGANGFFSVAAFAARLKNAAARAFAIDPTQPLSARNSYLGVDSNAVGAPARWTLQTAELNGLDDLVPFFVTLADAQAAKTRLAGRGRQTIVVTLPNDVWGLIDEAQVFGARNAAEAAAARDPRLVIVAFEEGFLLIDELYVDRAA